MRRTWTFLAFGLMLCCAAPAGAAPPSLGIEVLSNRAEVISAGDALVAVKVPAGVAPAKVRVFDDGRDVTSAFAVRANGRFEGLVTGLSLGPNVLTTRAQGAKDASITVTNHPNGGPVFSGPQVQPWVCQSSAVDSQCNQPASYQYRYKSTGGAFADYDPNSPPSDVASTTTDQGKTVPYIVRVETGYQDRDQYKIAVLYDPTKPFTAWQPQDGWNHKLLINHGASCGIDHQSGSAPDVENDAALSRGFAVMSTALNNAGHNCNIATQAESMVMAKERLVEQYGEIRYTIGTGCSGGSLTQQQVANAYPGIYQGILPACSFPDSWSTGQQLVDYHLVRNYTENPANWGTGVVWTPDAIAAVEGHPNHVNSIVFDTVYWTSLGVPDDGCPGVPAEQNYNAETNPGGVRCVLADYMINVLGPRPASVWSPAEQQVGHGFAGLPLDNVGVQYGLEALTKGQITTAQFVDLNDKIGGGTIDSVWTPERLKADQPALANAYKSGGINSANNLNKVAIIDLRGPDPGAFHDAYRSWAIRARLEREHGTFANQAIWFGAVPLMGDVNYATEAHGCDGPLACRRRGGPRHRLARGEDHPRPSERHPGPLHAGGRARGDHDSRHRPGLQPEGGSDQVRHAAHRRRRECRDGHQQVHAEAAAAPRLLPDRVHRRAVVAPPGGVPDRRLRLEPEGHQPDGRDRMADLPGRRGQRRLRRARAGCGTGELGHRLGERLVRLVAQLTSC